MRHLRPADAAALAENVSIARANGVPWKVLERVYNRSERQLRRYSLKRNNITKMSGFDCCGGDDGQMQDAPDQVFTIRGPLHHGQTGIDCHIPSA